jgi:hypothetical protein
LTELSTSVTITGRRILIVDDDGLQACMLERMLAIARRASRHPLGDERGLEVEVTFPAVVAGVPRRERLHGRRTACVAIVDATASSLDVVDGTITTDTVCIRAVTDEPAAP